MLYDRGCFGTEQYHVTGAVRRSKLQWSDKFWPALFHIFTRTLRCNISASRHPIHAVLVPLESYHHALSNMSKIARFQSLETKIFRQKIGQNYDIMPAKINPEFTAPPIYFFTIIWHFNGQPNRRTVHPYLLTNRSQKGETDPIFRTYKLIDYNILEHINQ